MNRTVLAGLFTVVISVTISGQSVQQRTATAGISRAVDHLITQYAENKLFNGSAIVVHKGRVLVKKGYGMANFELNVPNTSSTKFRIGSVTKQFTAALILKLYEAGKIDLDSKISRYLPWYRQDTGSKVSVRNLLGHTSGIPNYTTSNALRDIANSGYSGRQAAEKYCSGDLEFEPGTKFSYNNSGYFLLGLIIESVEGKQYDEVLRERILLPFGMVNSGLEHAVPILSGRAAGYEFGFSGYENTQPIEMAATVFSAGAIYSTVEDMARWHDALFGGHVISKGILDQMLTPGKGNYGHGIYIAKFTPHGSEKAVTSIGHSGGIFGFSALSIRYAEDDLSIILLDNTRVGKRGNLENIAVRILSILKKLPVEPLKKSIQVEVVRAVRQGRSGKEIASFFRDPNGRISLQYDYEGSESFLNDFGYRLLLDGKTDQSLGVLSIAVEKYPTSQNTFDTYAEALLKDGQTEAAIKNYRRVLELDPKNMHAAEQLRKLTSEKRAQ